MQVKRIEWVGNKVDQWLDSKFNSMVIDADVLGTFSVHYRGSKVAECVDFEHAEILANAIYEKIISGCLIGNIDYIGVGKWQPNRKHDKLMDYGRCEND